LRQRGNTLQSAIAVLMRDFFNFKNCLHDIQNSFYSLLNAQRGVAGRADDRVALSARAQTTDSGGCLTVSAGRSATHCSPKAPQVRTLMPHLLRAADTNKIGKLSRQEATAPACGRARFDQIVNKDHALCRAKNLCRHQVLTWTT
jgi:hypothetical protein